MFKIKNCALRLGGLKNGSCCYCSTLRNCTFWVTQPFGLGKCAISQFLGLLGINFHLLESQQPKLLGVVRDSMAKEDKMSYLLPPPSLRE